MDALMDTDAVYDSETGEVNGEILDVLKMHFEN
jgi:hypothetical protein